MIFVNPPLMPKGVEHSLVGCRATADNAQMKCAIGKLWEAHSIGRCQFVMSTRRGWNPIRDKVAGRESVTQR